MKDTILPPNDHFFCYAIFRNYIWQSAKADKESTERNLTCNIVTVRAGPKYIRQKHYYSCVDNMVNDMV